MHSLLSNLFLHLLESTVWVLVLLVALHLFRVSESRVRCWIYRVSLLKFLIPTLWIAEFFKTPEIGELAPFIVSAGASLNELNDLVLQKQPVSIAYGGLSIAVVLFLGSAILTFSQHRRIFKAVAPFEGKMKRLLAKVLEADGQDAEALSGLLIDQGPSVGLYGIFRPRIIAKRQFLECLDQEELVSAFQHEVMHWKQKDHIWRFMSEWVVCCFWFHPLLWYLRKQLYLETEKRCDEKVLASGTRSQSYANCLLKAAEQNQSRFGFSGAIALSETSLKQRVSNVLKYQYRKVNRMKIVTIAALAGVAFTGSLMVFGNVSGLNTSKGNPKEVLQLSEVDKKPIPKHKIEPVYPRELKELGINGKVVLKFVVNQNGDVEDIEIESSTDYYFEQPSIDALQQWKFFPGMVDGNPVKVQVRAPFVFMVTPESTPSPFSKISNSTDPADIEFMKQWEPKWKAIQDLRQKDWNSREEAEAWLVMAAVLHGELKAYMSKYENTVE